MQHVLELQVMLVAQTTAFTVHVGRHFDAFLYHTEGLTFVEYVGHLAVEHGRF